MLLILREGFAKVPPPRVFCKKRLEVIENKGRDVKKEGKETQRGAKPLITKGVARKSAIQKAQRGMMEV
jgi:hypothetical protein